jgi:hypothetical protein
LAFFSIFSFSPVPRRACSGPLAAEIAFDAAVVTVVSRPDGSPPSCLTRRSTARA